MKIPGLLKDSGGRMLAELAALVPSYAAVVEIGSYLGRSTCYMAAAASARVYAVDLWDMRLPDEGAKPRNKRKRAIRFDSTKAFKAFLRHLQIAKVEAKVTWIKGDAKEIAKAWSRPIGLLFIDGAHDRASVTADYELWSPHVVDGGWVAFHDAVEGSQVRKVIEDLVKPSGLWGDWHQEGSLLIGRRGWP